jgi:hypothetical protein
LVCTSGTHHTPAKWARNSRRLDERRRPRVTRRRSWTRARSNAREVEDVRRVRSLVVGDASARPREDREARTGKGTIPTFPRRRHDDDRDLRDDERAIDDVGGGGERRNEIVRAVWRRREG